MSDVPLKEHIESQLAALDRIFASQLASIRGAVDKAENQLNVRLQAMNEFREALRDQSGRLATKNEMDLKVESIEKRLQNLEMMQAAREGRANTVSAVVAAGVSIVVGVVIFVVTRYVLKP